MMNTTQDTLPVRIPPPPGRRPLAVFLVALSLSIGWGIRGNFGHEAGAMIPGALAALAACLLSGREDWRGRAPWFALFGGLGWAFGGSIAYMYCVSFAGSEHGPTALYGFLICFCVGGLWAGMGGAGTALPAVMDRKRLEDFFVPLLFVLVPVGAHALLEDTLSAWAQQHLAVDVDGTFFRHRNPLYWLDADWRPAVAALLGVCVFDLWDRRFAKAHLLAAFTAAGAAAGWGAQRLLDAAGMAAPLGRLLVAPLGDPHAVNPETGHPFDPAQFLTNWPQVMLDYPQHAGLAVGLIAGITLYFIRFGKFRRDAGLLLCMSLGWLLAFLILPVLGTIPLQRWGGLRMMPPRSDDWAGITGVFLGMTFYCLRRGLRPVAWAGAVSAVIGGFGFALVPFVRSLLLLPGHGQLTPGGTPPAWAHYHAANWHSILEQGHGFCHGLGIAAVMAVLAARAPGLADPSPPKRNWTDVFAVVFLLFGVGWLNVFKNVDEWTSGTAPAVPEIMKAPLVGVPLGAATWFNLVWWSAALMVTVLLAVHLRRRLDVVPRSSLGKGQLLYIAFLWMMVIANHERALAHFSEGRLVTEWVLFMNAVLATFLVLWLPGEGVPLPGGAEDADAWSLRRVARRALPVVLAGLMLMAAATRVIYGDKPVQHPTVNHKRFGPEAHWRIKPILKEGVHR